MQNQILRAIIFVVLVIVVTSDLKQMVSIITGFHSGPAVATLHGWMHPLEHKKSSEKKSNPTDTSNNQENIKSRTFTTNFDPGKFRNKIVHSRSQHEDDNKPVRPFNSKENTLTTLTDAEHQELVELKNRLTNIMQQWCLPKLVCELHASVTDMDSLTETERGLLTLIKETSLNDMGEVASRYHFAAHMGQLLNQVEGNGCHNLYPNCPLSGNKVLDMVKRVKIR